MAERAAPIQWNRDPKTLAICWILGFMVVFVINYFVFQPDFKASLARAFVLATIVVVLNWLGVGLPKAGATGKTGTKAA